MPLFTNTCDHTGPQIIGKCGSTTTGFEQEVWLLDAEKLLTAAVHKAELSSPADQRLGFLLSRLGRVEFQLGRYPEAVTAARHALVVDRTVRGGQFSRVLFDLQNVAYYSYRAGDSVAAEQAIDPHDEHVARTSVQLAELKMCEGEYSDAEHLCERALRIQEADYGPDNSQLVPTLDLYTVVERDLHNMNKANALAARATALRHKTMPGSLPRPR